jgi:hypothetical protein
MLPSFSLVRRPSRDNGSSDWVFIVLQHLHWSERTQDRLSWWWVLGNLWVKWFCLYSNSETLVSFEHSSAFQILFLLRRLHLHCYFAWIQREDRLSWIEKKMRCSENVRGVLAIKSKSENANQPFESISWSNHTRYIYDQNSIRNTCVKVRRSWMRTYLFSPWHNKIGVIYK